jgi:plastocyanin
MNISSTARVDRTIGITLTSNLTISVIGTDIISSSNFPITSSTGTITDKPDTLTVSGSDKVPPELMASSKEVLLALLNFETSEDSIVITNLIFDVFGTASYGNISEFKLYRDDNENGVYDPVGDTLLDNQGYSPTIKFECNQIINYGIPIQMLILVDIEPLATDGATFGISLDSSSNISISGSDFVSDTNLPFKTSLTTLRQHTDFLSIDWKDRAPSSLEANSVNITMLDLMLNTDNNSIMVENINCGIIGSASLSSLSKASLYRDEDDNGEYSDGVDTLLDSVIITSSGIKFSISELIEKDTQLRLVITVDTASSVDIGNSFGFALNTDSNLTVTSPDKVSSNNFPIVSSLVEFTGDISKPEVDSITMSKDSPLGTGTLTFTINFNEDMDEEIDPLVRFGKSAPFTTHTLTTAGWQDTSTWRGSYEIDSTTGDGQNILSISGAKDIAGNIIELDSSHSWIIDTTAPTVVAGSDITIDAGETTDFNATNSYDAHGIHSYKWEFQYDLKLQVLEGATPKFTFDLPGDYRVTLTVTDVVGNSANDSIWVHVIETVVEQPVIVSTTPEHNEEKVAIDTSVIIRFSISMSKSSVSGLLSIAPSELYDLYWGDNNRILRIKFRDDLEYNKTYTITLGAVEAEIGSIIEDAPFELVFKTKNRPIIPAKNSKPKLSEGTITPESGDTETEYTFSVNYYDPDGDVPSEIQVVIDGVAYDMEPKFGENPTNGMYELTTTLGKGEHSYYFTASDGYTDAISGDGITPAKLEDSQLTPAVDNVKRSQDDAGTMIWIALGIVIAIVAILLFFLLIKKRKKGEKTNTDNNEGNDESEKNKKNDEPGNKDTLNKTIKPRDTSFQIPPSTATTTKQIPKRLPKRLPKKN